MTAGQRTAVPSAVDRLLEEPAFGLSDEAKRPLFAAAMAEAFRHHFENNGTFRAVCLNQGISPASMPEDPGGFPYLPASLFKGRRLVSVPEDRIITEVRSSATSGVPSRVALDRMTSRRQSLVSARLMAEYLGRHRRPFLVADYEGGDSSGPALAARSAAFLGFLAFADSAEYLLEETGNGPALDVDRLGRLLADRLAAGRDICVFGMTHLLYAGLIRPILARGRSLSLPQGSFVAHIGGWKRLRDEAVDRDRFLADIGRALGVGEDRIVDFYGFTEQMGLVYGGAGRQPKTVPSYAEVLIRDFDTLRPAADGRPGLVQVLTPLPFSYPGISVLTEDVGRIVRRGGGAGGRGTQFEILGRAEGAEPRGCGDL